MNNDFKNISNILKIAADQGVFDEVKSYLLENGILKNAYWRLLERLRSAISSLEQELGVGQQLLSEYEELLEKYENVEDDSEKAKLEAQIDELEKRIESWLEH